MSSRRSARPAGAADGGAGDAGAAARRGRHRPAAPAPPTPPAGEPSGATGHGGDPRLRIRARSAAAASPPPPPPRPRRLPPRDAARRPSAPVRPPAPTPARTRVLRPRFGAVDRPAGVPRHRRGRPAPGRGLSAQAVVRAGLDLAGDALCRRGARGARRWARSAGGSSTRYRTYGAALVGAGAGIIYLSIWAASRLYGVLPPTSGIVGLALVSVGAGDDRVRHRRRGARRHGRARRVHGARPARPEPDQRRICCCSTSPAWPPAWAWSPPGGAGGSRPGRSRPAISAWAPSARPTTPTPGACCSFGLIGGTAGLYVGLRERWWETRLLTFSGGWTLLFAAGERIPQHWAVLAAGLVLSAPVWWHGLRRPQVLPAPLGPRADGPGWSAGEALYFFVTPVLLGLGRARPRRRPVRRPAVARAADRRDAIPAGRLPAAAAGVRRRRRGGAWPWRRWSAGSGVPQVWALLALRRALALARSRAWAGPTGAGTGCSPWSRRCSSSSTARPAARGADDGAFVGPWALALWGAHRRDRRATPRGSGGSRAGGRTPA